jgi:hypothetical protein
MNTPSNDDRADWANIALAAFTDTVGYNEPETSIGDLICDLGHLANRHGLDFLEIVKHGVGMWSAEHRNPDPYMNDTAEIFITQSNHE